jgi:DHA1 family inner membrane transport protein
LNDRQSAGNPAIGHFASPVADLQTRSCCADGSFRLQFLVLGHAMPEANAAYAPGVQGHLLVTLALAVGSFAIGTGEFIIMGLLPDVARSFSIKVPQAGEVITAYALGVVVGAPLIAVLAARLSRKTLLIALMAFFGLGNTASALAPDFWSLVAFRFP